MSEISGTDEPMTSAEAMRTEDILELERQALALEERAEMRRLLEQGGHRSK